TLAIPRRQARALLYRLAAHLRRVPREQLCYLFWPDTPEANARRSLAHLLTHLRRALPDPALVLTADDRVGLDPQLAWSAVAAAEQLLATIGPGRAAALQQVADLVRAPFLEGFALPDSAEFDSWAAQERQGWERRYLEALAALVEHHAAHRAYAAAIAAAERYLATDELAEEIHRRLIGLYAATGDRSAARRQFDRCAAALERELGVTPMPETQAIYEATLRGELKIEYVKSTSDQLDKAHSQFSIRNSQFD